MDMAREGIHPAHDTPVGAFARHVTVALAFNLVFAVGLAFFWFILRDYGPTARNAVGDHAVWILASLAHLWYYSSENAAFKVLVAALSLGVNAFVLIQLEKVLAG